MLGRVESARSRFVAQIKTNERKASLVVEIAPSLPPPRSDRCIREIAERSTLFAVANRTIRALFCETEPPILDTRSFSYSYSREIFNACDMQEETPRFPPRFLFERNFERNDPRSFW